MSYNVAMKRILGSFVFSSILLCACSGSVESRIPWIEKEQNHFLWFSDPSIGFSRIGDNKSCLPFDSFSIGDQRVPINETIVLHFEPGNGTIQGMQRCEQKGLFFSYSWEKGFEIQEWLPFDLGEQALIRFDGTVPVVTVCDFGSDSVSYYYRPSALSPWLVIDAPTVNFAGASAYGYFWRESLDSVATKVFWANGGMTELPISEPGWNVTFGTYGGCPLFRGPDMNWHYLDLESKSLQPIPDEYQLCGAPSSFRFQRKTSDGIEVFDLRPQGFVKVGAATLNSALIDQGYLTQTNDSSFLFLPLQKMLRASTEEGVTYWTLEGQSLNQEVPFSRPSKDLLFQMEGSQIFHLCEEKGKHYLVQAFVSSEEEKLLSFISENDAAGIRNPGFWQNELQPFYHPGKLFNFGFSLKWQVARGGAL